MKPNMTSNYTNTSIAVIASTPPPLTLSKKRTGRFRYNLKASHLQWRDALFFT